MSTRSSIAVQQDGKVKSVYCHFDGYPSHNGKMLLENYNSQEKADAIVALGDMSCLYESIECPEGHSYKNNKEGYSVFYKRDRGESDVDALDCATYEEALEKNHQDYNYFWDGKEWLVDGEKLTKKLIEND